MAPYNTDTPYAEYEKYSERTAMEWVRRYRAGESLASIGSDFGVGHETVRQYLARRGVSIRSRSEAGLGREHAWTKEATAPPSLRELAWAAGFIEGEGHIRQTKRCETIKASQNETEPLEQLQGYFGGSIREEGERCHTWTTYGGRARGIMMTLYPFFSSRRQQMVRETLHG